MSFEERAALCALNRIFGFEPKTGLRLIEALGGASAVFKEPEEVLRELGACSRVKYAAQIAVSAFESAAMELERLGREGCRFIGIGESGYPPLLMECEDPPLGLYYKGESAPEEVFGGLPQVAVVGTRSVTGYVRDVGERIAGTSGCALVTDYPPGVEAVKLNFIRRNRIIAGICRATILVESKIKGGGMMTARLASSYGRDVYALPGRIDDPFSQGCNLLIRENLAEQIGDLGELVSKLGLGRSGIRLKDDFGAEVTAFYQNRLPEGECEDIVRLAMAVKGHRGISVDDLCSKLKWTYSHTSRLVTTLECDGFISVDLLQHCHAG